jgi:5-methylcytosine-specific restriction endonuclease McrA
MLKFNLLPSSAQSQVNVLLGMSEVLPKTKVCTGPCGTEKDVEFFGLRTDKKGRIVRRSQCKECEVLATQDYLRRKKLGLGPKPKPVVVTPETKVCTKCKNDLLLKEFGLHKKGLYGLRSTCLVCNNQLYKDYADLNRDAINHKKREAWVANPQTEEQKQAAIERASAWYYANRERAYQNVLRWISKHPREWFIICARWRGKNPERIQGYTKAWRVRNPEWWQKRRAALASVENTLTTEEWLEVLSEYNHKCVYCGRSDVKLTMDHIIPISKGGPNIKNNVVPACRSCNSRKGAKDPSLFNFVVQRVQANQNESRA